MPSTPRIETKFYEGGLTGQQVNNMDGRKLSSALEEGGISSPRSLPMMATASQYFNLAPSEDGEKGDEANAESNGDGDTEDGDEEWKKDDRAILTPREWQMLRKRVAVVRPAATFKRVIRKNLCDERVRIQFIIFLAKAIWTFGAPHHTIQGILYTAAEALEVEANFLVSGSVIFVMIGTPYDPNARTYAIRGAGSAHLQNITEIEYIYQAVINDELSADEGGERLQHIIHETPPMSIWYRTFCAFMCSLAIGPIAFGSSFVDMWLGAIASGGLVLFQGTFAKRNPVLSSIYEVVASFCVSLFARGMSMVPGQIFCYEAISSAGIVMILPGYTMLTALLELFEDSKVPGVVRLVATLVYTIFFSAGLSMGSSFFFAADPAARTIKSPVQALAAGLINVASINGNFTVGANQSFNGFTSGIFTYTNDTLIQEASEHFIQGCYRNTSWPWYRQVFPWWGLFILVPIFSIFITLINNQRFRTGVMAVTVIASCISFTANHYATQLVAGAPPGFVGALVVGFLGHTYSRVWHKSSFPVMTTAVLFIVPSGLSNAGGLGNKGDYFSDILDVGLRMIEVVISIAFGLAIPNLFFMWAGGKKRTPGFEL